MKLKTSFPHPSFLLGLNFILSSSTSSAWVAQRDREWRLSSKSSQLFVSLLLPPYAIPLLQHCISLMAYTPSWTAPTLLAFHELLQSRSHTHRAVLQCESPMISQVQKTCFTVGSSLHATTNPDRSLIQGRFCLGSQSPSSTHLQALMWCHPWAATGSLLQCLPHHGLHHRLQRSLCFSAWSTSFPSFFTDLGICRAVPLIWSHSSLPAAAQCNLP